MEEQIVVGVDGSSEATAALEWALSAADLHHAEVETIAYSFSDGNESQISGQTTGHERAAELLREVVEPVTSGHPGVHVTQRVAEGSPAHVLIQAAANADLLVLGSRGRSGFAGSFLRSLSDKCLHHACCPVVTVRTAPPNWSPDRESPYTIVVGADGSQGSRNALRWAIDEAATHKGRVRVIHAWTSPYDWQSEVLYPAAEGKLHTRAEERLEKTVAGIDPGDVTVDAKLVEGDPRRILPDAARNSDLLVVGSDMHGRITEMLLGSVSSFCAHHASGPVVVVPGRGHKLSAQPVAR
jgi:nucleotide-binding universal stress UspA family protein